MYWILKNFSLIFMGVLYLMIRCVYPGNLIGYQFSLMIDTNTYLVRDTSRKTKPGARTQLQILN